MAVEDPPPSPLLLSAIDVFDRSLTSSWPLRVDGVRSPVCLRLLSVSEDGEGLVVWETEEAIDEDEDDEEEGEVEVEVEVDVFLWDRLNGFAPFVSRSPPAEASSPGGSGLRDLASEEVGLPLLLLSFAPV